ncbi:MAG: hypothetical protein NVSMB13_10070 [Mycobacteriales bacterium]
MWRARYRDHDGKERSAHFRRKIDAEGWQAERRAELRRGTHLDPAAGKVSFRDFAEQWRSTQPHRAGTVSLYETRLRLHVYPVLGSKPIGTVRKSHVQACVAGVTLGAAGTHQVYNLVRTIFRAAMDDRLIATSPCVRIALPELPPGLIVPPTMDQLRAIIQAAPASLKALITMAAQTGLRQGELLGLDTERVDFLRRTVTVDRQLIYVSGQAPCFGPPKTPKSHRTVPVPSSALMALAEHLSKHPPGPDGLIFRSEQVFPSSEARSMGDGRQVWVVLG